MNSQHPPADVAVILVAGIGQRLRPLTLDRPKALVPVGPETILGRAVRQLIEHGVRELVLATGFRDDAVREAMRECTIPVRYAHNPDYLTTQNAVSLLHCREAVGGRSFYKLDGDVLFHPEILGRLDASGGALAVAVDPRANLGAEEMKVRLAPDGATITAFGKGLDPAACFGESIGIERLGREAVGPLFDALGESHARGETNLYYEDVYSRMIEAGLVARAVPVGDLGWTEVDTPADLEAAGALVGSGRLGGEVRRS